MNPPCSGLDVWHLQIKLMAWGSGSDNDSIGNIMEPVIVSGKYDSRTRDAVMRFQKAHDLKITGMVDGETFRHIDTESARHGVFVHLLKCPCVRGDNDGAILCRCTKHDSNGKCDGFGKARFAGEYLTKGKKQADGTALDGEKLDLYDMEEYPGVDLAVLWAVRGLLHRADLKRIKISSGYRCWEDNYHHTDQTRWHHRRLTFHFGKAIEFYIADPTPCTDIGKDPKTAPCARCGGVRDLAVSKCGFQVRCIEPDRTAVAEQTKEAALPITPWSVHVNTVRRRDRKKEEEYVKTFFDSQHPLYQYILGFSLPVDLGKGKDPATAPTNLYYNNIEQAKGGWFPMGVSRTAHGGVHLSVPKDQEVFAIADGEVVGCRVGEADNAKTFGSRNFVLLRHKWAPARQSGPTSSSPAFKTYYSLYMHLDAAEALADSPVRWRKQLLLLTKDHIEPVTPAPLFVKKNVDGKDRLQHSGGLAVGELREATGAEVGAKSIDDEWPDDAKVVKLTSPADTYALTKLDGKEISKLVPKDTSLAGKIGSHAIIGLQNPIKVCGGELIGSVGSAPTDDSLKSLGTFLHLETFAEEMFITGAGWEELSVADAAKAVDPKELVKVLVAKKLIQEPADKVLLDEDVRASETDAHQEGLRSAVLKCPNGWAMDWKAALTSSTSLGFMKDPERNALGDKMNEYRWWSEVAPAGVLPGSTTVFHYHPIALLMAMIYG